MSGRWRRVFVEYPRGVRTGGPEALHQLVDSLRRHGQEAFLLAVKGGNRPRVPDYRRYDAPEAVGLRPTADDALVVPEAWLGDRGRSGAAVHTWWLSVDNAIGFQAEHAWSTQEITRSTRHPAVLRAAREAERIVRPAVVRRLRARRHLAQSQYAADFVEARLRRRADLLSDYVTTEPTDRSQGRTGWSRRPVVSYLAAKSGAQIDELRVRLDRDVEWLPIAGMTQAEVTAALRRTDVFMDLGRQPGKDRMPREAATAGAVTLLLGVGAGANAHDFPLPPEHRLSITDDPLAALTRVLEDLPHHRALQEGFRAHVAGERARFDDEVAAVFLRPDPARTE